MRIPYGYCGEFRLGEAEVPDALIMSFVPAGAVFKRASVDLLRKNPGQAILYVSTTGTLIVKHIDPDQVTARNRTMTDPIPSIPCSVPPIVGFRLDLGTDPDFTRKSWGDRVKRVGGRYDKAAGRECRFVHLPNTPESRALVAELIERFPGHERFGGKPGTTIVLDATAEADWRYFTDSSPRRVHTIASGKPAAEQIDALLTRWERQARAWWQAEGEPAARKRAEQHEAYRQERIAAWPAGIAGSIREALAAGVAPETIRTAVEQALPDPRGNLWCCAQDDDGACMETSTGRVVHRALDLSKPDTRCGHVLRPGEWRATNDAHVTCQACKEAP